MDSRPTSSTEYVNLFGKILIRYWRPGVSIANSLEPKIKKISIDDDEIVADLMDGRTISIPLAWSWRLSEATEEQRNNYKIIADGIGIHWPDVDEDISAQGMLTGTPARPSKQKV